MLLIRNIGQVVTVAGGTGPRAGRAQAEIGLVEHAAVLIDGDSIALVGTEADILKRLPAGVDIPEIDALGQLVTPGLVDAHTHLVHGGRREREYEQISLGATYAQIMAAGGGIHATVAATRASSLTDLIDHAKRHLSVMLAHGTTTCESKSGYGLDIETELRQLEAMAVLDRSQPVEIIPTFMGAHAVPIGSEPDEYANWLCNDAIPRVAEQGIARFNDVFCEHGVFTINQSERILRAGISHGLAAKIHADELCDGGGAELAAQVLAVSADHLHCAADTGLEAMRDAGTIAVLLPGTAVFLGLERHAPARRMVDAGVPIALGTDFNPGSCYCESMPLIMSFACSQIGLSAGEALVAATRNAAHASRVGDRVGSIEPGKQADIVVWDCDDYRMIPYHMGANLVRTVVKRGVVVHHM